MVVCSIRIDFVPAEVPGQLKAVVNLVTPEGVLIGVDQPQLVGAGKSLALGPVQVLAGLPAHVAATPPPPKGLTAGQAAAQLAATGS